MPGDLVYRRVYTCVWQDTRFRGLSAAAPNAQTLWIYLLTGEHTGPIPGLARAGEAALAEALGWPVGAFRRCWREIEAQRMAEADWGARVVWLPNGLRYDAPANPNVVKGWRRAWREIPDCVLKDRARAKLDAHCTGRGAPFADAFREVCGNDSGNRSANRSMDATPNQDQDQEQDHDHGGREGSLTNVRKVLDAWNDTAARRDLPRCRGAGKVRDTISTRLRAGGWLEAFHSALVFIEGSSFHRGENDRRWKANLEWLLRPGKAEELADKAAAAPVATPEQLTLNGREDLS